MSRSYVCICAAKKCYNTKLSHPHVEFFGFPSDFTLCKRWLDNCGRSDLNVNSVCKSNGYYKLCADHFEEKWFTDGTKMCLIRNINPVPTIFMNNIKHLLPHGSHTNLSVDIDMPFQPPLNTNDPASLDESVLNVSEDLVGNEQLSISYHSTQFLKREDFEPNTISKALLNLKPETELYQIDDLCRFCMNKVLHNYVKIFSDSIEASEIRRMCAVVMPKKIQICDGLPHKICRLCIIDLKTCRRLMEKFQFADRYLRSIAKYSLFIENEDYGTTDSEEDECGMSEKNILKPIPKNAMVIPFKNFKPVLEGSQSYFEEMGPKTSIPFENCLPKQCKDSEIADDNIGREKTDQDFNTETAATSTSVNQLLESLPLPTSQIKLITAEQSLWKDNVKLICSNIILPIKDGGSEKSLIFRKHMNDKSEENQEISDFDIKHLGTGHIDHLATSKCGNEDENSEQENCESIQIETPSDIINSNSLSRIIENIYELNKKSEENSSTLTVSYKCLECYGIFTTYPSLVDHVLNRHKKLKNFSTYSCKICSKKFKYSTLLLEHVKTEHPSGTVKCSMCDLNCNSKDELKNHFENEHIFKCTFCETVMYSQKGLEKHISAKHDTRTKCDTCGKQLSSVFYRKIHEMMHDPNCSEICWVCGLVLKTKYSLRDHMKLHDNKTFTCQICDKVFKTKVKLSRHEKTHRPKCIPVKNFLCEFCPRRFVYERSLTIHMFTHSKVKPFKCDFCGKGFTKKKNFQLHEEKRNNHGGVCPKVKRVRGPFTLKELPSLPCDICGRKFIKASSVQRHRKYHFCSGNPEIIQKLLDEPEVHKCEVCGRHFFSKRSLQSHMRIHTGALKPFQCEFCENCYASLHHMIIHERTHTGEKPFKCCYCDKSFCAKKNLEPHEVSHTEDRPHKCKYCDKTFKTRSRLLIHMSIHKEASSIRPYPCSQCGQRFMLNKWLLRHIKDAHSTDAAKKANIISDSMPDAPHQCSQCGRRFFLGRYLRRHIKTVHTKEKVPCLRQPPRVIDVGKKYPCSKCRRLFASEIRRQRHIEKVHNFKETVEIEHLDEEEQVQYLHIDNEDDKNISSLEIQELPYIISPEEYAEVLIY